MQIELLAGQRNKREKAKAVTACNDWLRLGPGRSLPRLLRKYTELTQSEPPTRSLQTLKVWSTRYGWMKRAELFDATWEERKNAERRAELEQGLALDYERIRKLKELFDFLDSQVYAQDQYGDFVNVWMPDVKQIGRGELAERVDLVRFNAPLIEQFRKVLDDLAQETGGRIKKQEVTGADGGGIVVENRIIYSAKELTDDELARIIANGAPKSAESNGSGRGE